MTEQKSTAASDDITRRRWLLILGKLAALSGFSGVVPELAGALSGPGAQASLPPGLYHPSEDHLTHALAEAGGFHPIPPGSETEYVRPNSLPFQPQFLSAEEFKIVSRFIAVLLADADSGALSQATQWLDLYLHSASAVREAALNLDPSHRALAVAYYGEKEARELETANPQAIVRSGLAALQQLSLDQYGHKFLELEPSQQTDLVSLISNAELDSAARKFFETTRTEAARGYYTSAQGLKDLDYKGNWYYGSCPDCGDRT